LPLIDLVLSLSQKLLAKWNSDLIIQQKINSLDLLASRRETWNKSQRENPVDANNLKIKFLKLIDQADQKLRE
jgi:hypothetical protein